MAHTQKAHSYMTYYSYKKKKKLFFYMDSKYNISNTDLIDSFHLFVEGGKC